MTDSENDSTSAYQVQKEIEGRLLGILDESEEVPLSQVLAQLSNINNNNHNQFITNEQMMMHSFSSAQNSPATVGTSGGGVGGGATGGGAATVAAAAAIGMGGGGGNAAATTNAPPLSHSNSISNYMSSQAGSPSQEGAAVLAQYTAAAAGVGGAAGQRQVSAGPGVGSPQSSGIYTGTSEEAVMTRQVLRAIKILPQVEIITDPLRGTTVVRRATHIPHPSHSSSGYRSGGGGGGGGGGAEQKIANSRRVGASSSSAGVAAVGYGTEPQNEGPGSSHFGGSGGPGAVGHRSHNHHKHTHTSNSRLGGPPTAERRAARLDRATAKIKKGLRFNEVVSSQSNPGRVGYVCVADEFKLEELCEYYDKLGYSTNLQFDVLHVTTADNFTHGGGGGGGGIENTTTTTTNATHNNGLTYRGTGGSYGSTSNASHRAVGGGSGSGGGGGGSGNVSGSTNTASSGSTYGGASHSSQKFDLFLFDYGVVVWWGTHNRAYRIVETDFTLPNSNLTRFMVNRYQTSLINDNFPVWCTFSIEPKDEVEPDKSFADRLKYDHFDLPNESPDVKLCISHALGQSGKIDYLELKVEQLNHHCKPLPRELKERGWVTISEQNLLQLRGEVLFLRLMLKSGSDLLDEPDLFWQHPWLKPLYNVVKEAFQISDRVETLDTKLATANEILSMISDQFNQRHGSRLEWIVIWLVAVEVIIGVLELLVDARPWILGYLAGTGRGAGNH